LARFEKQIKVSLKFCKKQLLYEISDWFDAKGDKSIFCCVKSKQLHSGILVK
jgi:hypothetical protein